MGACNKDINTHIRYECARSHTLSLALMTVTTLSCSHEIGIEMIHAAIDGKGLSCQVLQQVYINKERVDDDLVRTAVPMQ